MTLAELIHAYQTDVDSGYHKLEFNTRVNNDRMLRRICRDHGAARIEDIKARLLLVWQKGWIGDGGHVSMAHALIGQLRTVFGFGFTLLEDAQCERLCGILHEMRFEMGRPRGERMTADQANAIRAAAHALGLPSIALAQALQFEGTFRQRDVIGGWVPTTEPGISDVVFGGEKWVRGLRWSEIDSDLVLTHVTSKKKKEITVDLRLAPMVMEELARFPVIPASGPIIVCEATGRPYVTSEFRRKFRIVARRAGVPDAVKNMDSRAGAISEATDAGAPLELVRHAATHSNISTTQNYSRGTEGKVAEVMRLRVEHRNRATGGESE